jgi:hypothetical protein
MINLWYDSDEVTGFHPVVETAIKNAITNCGYDSLLELEHHPPIPNSTIVPDFAIKLKSNNRYIFVIEVKKTARDVTSQRFQNQSRNYVTDLATNWAPNYPKYFCLTNIEELILFADRQGPISTCILKGNPKSHTRFNPQTRDATQTSIEFQATFEQLLPIIYNRTQPDWDNNWQPIIDSFYQNFQSVSSSLTHNKELSDELSLYELFRLLAFTYLKDYYNQTNNPNQSYFRTFPPASDNLQNFKSKLSNNYNRVIQLDFNQVFSNHPNSTDRIFPENFSASILQYFKNTIQALNNFGSQAVSDNPLPEYIFNLLTSKVYDKQTLHKKGKIMSDTELSILLATVTIENTDSNVIDPCSGDGALLDAAYDYLNILNLSNNGVAKSHNQLLNQVSGIEYDPFLAQLATFRLVSKNLSGVDNNTNANIQTGNAFTKPNSSGFDVLLMNPPFLRNDNPDAPITIADKALMNNAITSNGQSNFVTLASQPNLYFYFVNYTWHYLNPQGRAGLILMAKFLNNEEGEHLKQFILDKVDSIILYPRNYFEDFKVTTVITVISKQPTNEIKFLRIINPDLLSRPDDIKSILSSNTTTINSDYTLKITDRNINPSDNWRTYLIDPEEKFNSLSQLTFLEPLDTFFEIRKRGGAGNSGESKTIFPDLRKTSYSSSNIGFGIKNSKAKRKLILDRIDLKLESALHFPSPFDDNSQNGLNVTHHSDTSLKSLFDLKTSSNAKKWRKIVNETYNANVKFDLLIPRNERTKQTCYYNPFSEPVVLSTNFFYYSKLQNENTAPNLDKEIQVKFIAAFLNSCFGQIQFEINSNNQDGTRKLEGFHLDELRVPDLRLLSKTEIDTVVTAFENLSAQNITVSGDEGLSTQRRQLDEEIAKIIFAKNNLGFSSSIQLTNFFELFLADLVEDRRL